MIGHVFDLISADVVARLASANVPALVDGAVLLGPENSPLVLSTAAPRITLVPIGGTITKKSPATPPFFSLTDPLYLASITEPWIWTDIQSWRADIAGVQYVDGAASSSLAANWDWAAAYLYVLIQSLTGLVEGTWKPDRYEWIDSKRGSTALGGFGRQIAFYFSTYAPVLLYNLQAPAPLAAPGLGLVPPPNTSTISITGGSAADSIVIDVP